MLYHPTAKHQKVSPYFRWWCSTTVMLMNGSLQVIQTSLAQTEKEWMALRGSCPSSLPALPWSQRDNGSKREAENDLLVTWPFQHFRGALLATERKQEREREGYLCGTAAQRRAVWLLSGSDKIPLYSGRHSLGRETWPGGRDGLLPDGEWNNVMCAKQRRTEDVHANTDACVR